MMRAITLLLCTLLIAHGAAAQNIAVTGPNRVGMLEDESYPISWDTRGIRSVSVVAHGERTPLGQASRGRFRVTIAEGVSAGQGGVSWTVPWIDARQFFIKVKGYDNSGRLVAVHERGYNFRPKTLANRTHDGIYLDLSTRNRQRLYVQRDYRIIHAYLSSSSENYNWRSPGSHVRAPHDHAGVYRVIEKDRMHWSSLYDVWMPYAMRYHGGHFIHATSRNLYGRLGEPASHGCNRMTRHDARQLYISTPLGTRVEVIGP